MMKSKNALGSSRSSRESNVKAEPELMLDITNIRGRRCSTVLSVSISNVRTVVQLKKAIETRHKLFVQEILYRGVRLTDDRQLAYLLPALMKIGNSPRFAMRTRLLTSRRRGDVSFFVRGLHGSSFQVHVPIQSPVAELANAIRRAEGYDPKQGFDLLCNGKTLDQEGLFLPRSNSHVHVIARLLGGCAIHLIPSQTFVDMENTASLVKCRFVPGDPNRPWKSVSRGLNIQGKCRNFKCKAYECDVYCRKKFTVFNIAEPVTCPVCDETIAAVTCGFWGCEWMFEGRKRGSGMDLMSKWNKTGDKEFHWFDDEGGRNRIDWSSLVITVKSLSPELGILESCALCFGPALRAGLTTGAACRHAVHAECAREYKLAGYTNCPTCRLPLHHGA